MELQSVWGWQPALYLFLGGMGAGAFITAAVLYLKDKERHALIVCASMWAAAISLIVGLLLLLMELVTPARGLLMWQSFSHFTSWMTYGAWGAFAAIIVFGISALLATPPLKDWLSARWTWFKAHERGIRSVLSGIGIALGAFVAFYTGMLLMASGSVPFWNTLLLPVLFTVSAFDTGVALVEVTAVLLAKKEQISLDAKRLLERCVVVLVLVEAVVLAAFLGSMLSADTASPVGSAAVASATMFVSGQLAVWFWALVAVVGLALPLCMALRGLLGKGAGDEVSDLGESKPLAGDAASDVAAVVGAGNELDDSSLEEVCTTLQEGEADAKRKPPMDAATLVGAAGALVGGCALRFLVLAAGIHADVVAETIFKMIN